MRLPRGRRRERRVYARAIVVWSVASAVFVAADFSTRLTAVVVVPFVLVAPGLVLVLLLRIRDLALGATVVILCGIAVGVLVPSILLYVHAWSPLAVFAIVAGVTVAGAAVARDVAHGTASWQESVPARLDGFGRGVLGSARAVATGLLGTSVRRLSRDGAEQVPGSPVLERRVPERWRFACSAGAFALTLCLWLVVGSGIGQPLHALAVVAFLAAPALLAGRFVRASGPVETGFFSLGIAAATWGIAAAATFISQDWTPESAVVICVSALVGCVSAVDLSQSLRRRRRAVVA